MLAGSTKCSRPHTTEKRKQRPHRNPCPPVRLAKRRYATESLVFLQSPTRIHSHDRRCASLLLVPTICPLHIVQHIDERRGQAIRSRRQGAAIPQDYRRTMRTEIFPLVLTLLTLEIASPDGATLKVSKNPLASPPESTGDHLLCLCPISGLLRRSTLL